MLIRRGMIALLVACIGMSYGQPPDPDARFDAAAIRPAPTGVRSGLRGGPGTSDPARIVWILPLRILILRAFSINEIDQLSGPESLDFANWEVSANIPEGASEEQFEQMLRNLLVDRFHMRFHLEETVFPAFNLVINRKGAKLKISESLPVRPPSLPRGAIYVGAVPVSSLRSGGGWTITGRAAKIPDLIRGA